MPDSADQNISVFAKKRAAYLATDPRCSECNGKIFHLSTTGMCEICRRQFNARRLHERNKANGR